MCTRYCTITYRDIYIFCINLILRAPRALKVLFVRKSYYTTRSYTIIFNNNENIKIMFMIVCMVEAKLREKNVNRAEEGNKNTELKVKKK